jgi:hypothetical protein
MNKTFQKTQEIQKEMKEINDFINSTNDFIEVLTNFQVQDITHNELTKIKASMIDFITKIDINSFKENKKTLIYDILKSIDCIMTQLTKLSYYKIKIIYKYYLKLITVSSTVNDIYVMMMNDTHGEGVRRILKDDF